MLIRDEKVIIKGLIHQDNITIINIYRLNIEAHKYKKMLTDQKEEIDNNTVIVVDFNTSLS